MPGLVEKRSKVKSFVYDIAGYVVRLPSMSMGHIVESKAMMAAGRIRSRCIVFRIASVCIGLGIGRNASAHGFGQRYDLPVPLTLWVLGAGATILLSFVIVVVSARGQAPDFRYPRVDLLRWPVFRALAQPAVRSIIRLAGVIGLCVAVGAGFWGHSDPFHNVTPVLVWVIWWVGVAYACALIGDLWVLINPFRTLFFWAEVIVVRVTGHRLSLERPYPKALGMWPAVLGLIGFFWAELVWRGGSVPWNLAMTITAYSVFTWIGMYIYGREVWLQNGDTFSVMFGIFSRFAPLELRVTDPAALARCPGLVCGYRRGDCVNGYVCLDEADPRHREWNLRPPGVGLLNDYRVPVSMMFFVLALLASVTFDGFLETSLWIHILDRTLGDEIVLVGSAALVFFSLLFCTVFMVFCWLIRRFAAMSGSQAIDGRTQSTGEVAGVFVLTLVPIAIAYHLAHYLSYLVITGQYLIPLISDPFGFGWNLFGTTDYEVDIGALSAWFAWYAAVISVVVGHVISVYIAHLAAYRFFRDPRAALFSQIPMVVLMMLYTMLSLWILAQPMVD